MVVGRPGPPVNPAILKNNRLCVLYLSSKMVCTSFRVGMTTGCSADPPSESTPFSDTFADTNLSFLGSGFGRLGAWMALGSLVEVFLRFLLVFGIGADSSGEGWWEVPRMP